MKVVCTGSSGLVGTAVCRALQARGTETAGFDIAVEPDQDTRDAAAVEALLADCDGVFVSATDAAGLRLARQAKVLTATPRLRLPVLQEASLPLDALIGSGLDPGEQLPPGCLKPTPSLQIATEGDAGGRLIPGGRYSAEPLPAPMVESYGCGDSFAAGVTAGLAAGWSVNDAVALGARCGAACATRFGPYG